MDAEDIDTLLRKKRKIRDFKACYPCRRRKVKCSDQIPCTNCMARDHANLCTLEKSNDANGLAHKESMWVHPANGGHTFNVGKALLKR